MIQNNDDIVFAIAGLFAGLTLPPDDPVFCRNSLVVPLSQGLFTDTRALKTDAFY